MISYTKYNSCGNDFIIVDNRQNIFVKSKLVDFVNDSQSYIKKICDRHHGIGADGFILLENPNNKKNSYKMTYYNSDGLVSTFCGNGSMCCANFAARILGDDKKDFFSGVFETSQGEFFFKSNFESFETKISMIDVFDIHTNDIGKVVDTGSPHIVIYNEKIDSIDVDFEGHHIRNSNIFKKNGINVTFTNIKKNKIFIRTYERGVESETLSCGTGAVAAVLCSFDEGLISENNVDVFTRGGVLNVSFEKNTRNIFTNIFLKSIVKREYEAALPIF
ncbi:MAG: diaminopimelate epimerase [Bacteroidota bacterium]|jgi:diaminopimelate epimerase|nr:diaminopimelate epimerase [Bacteroidota bacterium]